MTHRAAAVLLLFVAIAAFYSYRGAYYPSYDFDEFGFLNIPYRLATYGDLKYPVYLDGDAFNSDEVRKYPPLLTLLLRSAFHAAFGFSDASSRLLSGALVLLTTLICWLVLRRIKTPWPLAILAVVAIAFQPALFLGARVVRLEQEILFQGFAGLFLPFILSQRSSGAWAWMLGGVLTAWAGASHPWGLVFPTAAALSLLVFAAPLRGCDGLTFWRRALAWSAGAALPIAVSLFSILQDWGNYRDFVAWLAPVYGEREQQNIRLFTSTFGHRWVVDVFPRYIAAVINQLSTNTFFDFQLSPRLKHYAIPFALLFWLEFALVAVAAVPVLLASRRSTDLLPAGVAYLLAGATMAMALAYPPNFNYYLYPVTVIPLGAAIAVSFWWQHPPANRVARHVPVVLLGLSALHALLFATQQSWQLTKPATKEAIPLDARIDALKRIGREIGLADAPNIYCDLSTWPACGREMRSAFQAFGAGAVPPRSDIGGAVFFQPAFAKRLDQYPSRAIDPRTEGDKRVWLARSLERMQPVAVALVTGHGIDLAYRAGAPARGDLLVAEVRAGGATRWYRARPLTSPVDSGWSRLAVGPHLLIGNPHHNRVPPVILGSTRLPNMQDWERHAHLHKVTMVNVENEGDALRIEDIEDYEGFTLYRLEALPR